MFNTTSSNISAILQRSVIFAEETGIPTETTELSQVTDRGCIEYSVSYIMSLGCGLRYCSVRYIDVFIVGLSNPKKIFGTG